MFSIRLQNVAENQVMMYDLLNTWGHEGYELHCEKYVI